MTLPYYARIVQNEIGAPPKKQLLVDHLTNVAFRAGVYMTDAFGVPDGVIGYSAGLAHDLGKTIQEFIDAMNAGIRGAFDHSCVGAAYVRSQWPDPVDPDPDRKVPISLSASVGTVVCSHHTGLRNYSDYSEDAPSDLGTFTKDRFIRGEQYQEELLDRFDPALLEQLPYPTVTPLPTDTLAERRDELRRMMAFWTRFLHGSLVRADWEDASFAETPGYQSLMDGMQFASIEQLSDLLDQYMEWIWSNKPYKKYAAWVKAGRQTEPTKRTKLNKIKNEILRSCLPTAYQGPGVYRMQVPTGGGKTLLSMLWGLRHVYYNQQRRIITTLPYTTITRQNADVLRDVFGADNVCEHHSDIAPQNNTFRNRLAVPNWNAPIVVTTMLQLFESLRSAQNHRLRKLPAIPKSLIVMDEAQVLDPALLDVTLDSIKRLRQMGCSILLMTATQPALERRKYFPGGLDNMRDVVPNSEQYVDRMRRVQVDWDFTRETNRWRQEMAADEMWDQLNTWFRRHRQVLIIGSTRNTVKEIYRRLPPRGRYHLSRRMCSVHIRDTIAEIIAELEADRIVRVASTNLIEAGVELDFPTVYRMMCGLDSLVQASGRCDRDGLRSQKGRKGTLRPFFCPTNPPFGMLEQAANIAALMIKMNKLPGEPELDIFDPEVQRQFFEQLYETIDPDNFNVLNLEAEFRYEEVDWQAKWIKNTKMTDVVIPWQKDGRRIVNYLAKGEELPFDLARKLQNYVVSIYPNDFDRLVGLLQLGKNVRAGLDVYYLPEECMRFYDPKLGLLVPEDLDGEIFAEK